MMLTVQPTLGFRASSSSAVFIGCSCEGYFERWLPTTRPTTVTTRTRACRVRRVLRESIAASLLESLALDRNLALPASKHAGDQDGFLAGVQHANVRRLIAAGDRPGLVVGTAGHVVVRLR